MRVLHVIQSLAPGGAEHQLLRVVRSTGPHGIEHTVVQVGGARKLAETLEASGARVIDLGCDGRRALPRAVLACRAVLRELEPDVVHSWLFEGDIVARMASRRGSPGRLVSSAQLAAYEPDAVRAAGWPRHSVAMRRALDAITARSSETQVVGCSTYVTQSCVRRLGVPEDRARTIYNAVDQQRLGTSQREIRTSLRERLGFTDHHTVILSVGRLTEQKGHKYLISAFGEARAIRPDLRLVIAGGGPLEETLRRQIVSAALDPAVRLLGVRSDVPDLLAGAELFVFPSLFEGLPVAALEAMNAGVPIIATRVPGLREVIEHERNGVLVDPEDSAGLSAAILDLATDGARARRLAVAARETVAERFSLEATTPMWVGLYDELSGAGSAPMGAVGGAL